ncbi:tetratricopeptide repeat protein [Candidatus Aerophobetes bacterium]|nr:tetratricopeptide repeat protein [Candidatus Aerophobetes bacterium]
MYEYLKKIWEFLKSIDKRKLRIYGLLGGIGIAAVAAFWIYTAQMKKMAVQKFVEATSFYMEAKGQDKKEKAIQEYKKAKFLYKQLLSQYHWINNREEVLFNLSNCLYALREYDEAAAVLKKLVESYQDSYFLPWVELKLAGIYEKEKKYSLAIEVYKKIQEKYGDSSVAPEATLGIGRCQELLGKKKEALKSYQILISRYPLSKEAKIGEMKISKLE